MNPLQFKNFSLSDELLKAIELLHFEKPTKVQHQTIPVLLDRRDIIVNSHTGSGKTAAFAIPICELVDWEENKPQALVITPTRELAMQVRQDCFHIGRFKRLKVAALIGKAPFFKQEKELKQKTHIVVGTPGRLIDHLERGTLDASQIQYLIIDEADEMLRMGFVEQVETILKSLPQNRVTAVFSATMPEHIQKLCKQYMNNPLQVMIEEENSALVRIEQCQFEVNENQKLNLLKGLVIVENPDSCMVFCNTQLQVDAVYEELAEMGLTCARIHGGMEQSERLRVMDDFKKGYFRYLAATDVAARGIDIDQISLVINFDVPNTVESYVHRIGRTGRIGHAGKAMTFVSPKAGAMMTDIENYIDMTIPLLPWPDEAEVAEAEAAFAEKINAEPDVKIQKGARLNEGILRLHINAGKKTKLRPVDIVGTLCALEDMTAADIGIINILDVSAYVEILNGKGERVLAALQNKPIKGRVRRVSKAVLND